MNTRIAEFLSYFEAGEVQNQLKINKSVSEIPFNGFSYFNIEFKGEIPDYIHAFHQMNVVDKEIIITFVKQKQGNRKLI
jgi:hypothetical protein